MADETLSAGFYLSGDTLDGHGGADLIVGGPGDDVLKGGAGNDVFFCGFAIGGQDPRLHLMKSTLLMYWKSQKRGYWHANEVGL